MKKIDNIIGGAGIVLMIASLIWYSIGKIWGTWHWALLVLGAAGVIYFLVMYYSKREKKASSRTFKQGTNVALQIIILVAILSMLGFITTRQHFRTDLTQNHLYSLSDKTEKVLKNLKKDVDIKAFFKSTEQGVARDLLDEYSYRSAKLNYELIDPDENPEITKKYRVRKYGTLVVESGAKHELVEKLNEENITNAIIKVTREQDKVIYFTTGHGERSIKDNSVEGLKLAADEIEKENHIVRELNLARRRSIPDSCTVLAIVRPQANFLPGELDTIKAWLDKGGKLLLMVDPEHPSDIADFAAKYHVTIGNDMVIDVSGVGQLFGAGPAMPLVTSYDSKNPITKGFNIMTFYPFACSVRPMEDAGAYIITSLIKTSPQSWAETNYTGEKVGFDSGQDIKGPIDLGVVVEKDVSGDGKTVLVIFGDSDFAKNAYVNNQGNKNLFLNTVNYLAEEEDLISIRPKEVEDRRLTLTQAEVATLFYLVVIAIPLIVVIIGVVIFIRRNR